MTTSDRAFRQRFVNTVRKAVYDADDASRLGHPGLVGRLREICVTQILQPALPPEIKCGTGQLTDCHGNLSNEVDVILYAPEILPPALFDEKNGIFPIESCLYAIEVKSKLTALTVRDAIEKAKAIRGLNLLPTEYWFGHQGHLNQPAAYPVNALFAFGTDLGSSGKSELDRYREYDSATNTDSQVKVISVRGSGYWYHTNENGKVVWKQYESSETFDEIIDFVSGVSNTIPQLLAKKGRPRLGHYLSNNRPCKDV